MLSFDGRVVVITGAGRGLGRASAEAIAGCAGLVVVHDGGLDRDGTSPDPSVAEKVARQLRAAGMRADSRSQDLSSRAGCEELVG